MANEDIKREEMMKTINVIVGFLLCTVLLISYYLLVIHMER